ncbi:hypothetical protein GDO78_017852 [Eleutherodactylus coqui]|uniref:Uncharacterized protein n=1 Tax=Eleutherodactylus coqui TaxID=57060 RepID=A0A8J6E9X5_ELECQ|nr:hypothetical protein GDO78_017852 [Eleutherodactylus coqui]
METDISGDCGSQMQRTRSGAFRQFHVSNRHSASTAITLQILCSHPNLYSSHSQSCVQPLYTLADNVLRSAALHYGRCRYI